MKFVKAWMPGYIGTSEKMVPEHELNDAMVAANYEREWYARRAPMDVATFVAESANYGKTEFLFEKPWE